MNNEASVSNCDERTEGNDEERREGNDGDGRETTIRGVGRKEGRKVTR
jgi:hypothetical protein